MALINLRDADGITLLDTSKVRCGAKTAQGLRCLNKPSSRGEIDLIVTPAGDFKAYGRCGHHVNKDEGDDYRSGAIILR